MRIQENPLTMTRPPLVPKAFQPPRGGFHISSARAASQSHEMTVSHNVPTRSIPSNQAHFLDGFNVDECFDVRAIPDPPSPSPRLKRRLSSPNLARSLEDVTNQGSAAKNSKRIRRSLCHIPSPIEQRDEAGFSGREEPPPQQSHGFNIDIDFDDTSEQITRGKRRKKRQSMAIPKDLVLEHADGLNNQQRKPAPVPSPKNRFEGSFQNMQELQNLVRNYCDLPLEQRNSSKQAKAIQDATGYPLLNPAANKEDNPMGHANQRAILQRLAPVIDEMDRRKTLETAYWESETNCRVEKSRSGKYRYYSLDTNTKVSSHEYKLRYMASLERGAAYRFQLAEEWKAKLKRTEPRSSEKNTEEESFSNFETDESSQDFDLDLDSILAMEKRIEDNDADSTREGDTMELCDVSNSFGISEQSILSQSRDLDVGDRKNGQQAVTPSGINEEQKIEASVEPCPGTETDTVVEKQHESSCNDSDGDAQILPFPDRDETSSNPDIAAAEQRLWDKIDEALRDYSREVVSIMQKQRQSKDANSLMQCK